MHSGSCLCAAVKYRIDAPIESVGHCHCAMCRKAHGAAFASYTNVRRRNFHFTQGEDSLGIYQSSPSVTRTFCKHCGSTLQWYSEQPYPDWLSVALGTLDTPVGEIAQKHIFPQDKADWYTINDGMPLERRS